MNIKDYYPLCIDEQLKKEFGTENYKNIKNAFNEGNIEEFVEDLFKNPKTNYYYASVKEEEINSSTQRFIAIFSWLKYKQIYKFDKDLWDLIQDVNSLEIHCSVFQSLPFPVFYIDHPFNNDLKGCIVMYGEIEDQKYIKFVFFADNNTSFLCLPLNDDIEGKTIEELIQNYVGDTNDYDISWFMQNMRSALNCIIYLCTENPDISTSYIDMPNIPGNKSKDKKRKPSKKNKLNVSNVGTKIGKVIRDSRSDKRYHSEATGTGKQKSPHIRKAHYHSFWTGTGEDRKLIVRFLSPMFIHGNDIDKNIATIRRKQI